MPVIEQCWTHFLLKMKRILWIIYLEIKSSGNESMIEWCARCLLEQCWAHFVFWKWKKELHELSNLKLNQVELRAWLNDVPVRADISCSHPNVSTKPQPGWDLAGNLIKHWLKFFFSSIYKCRQLQQSSANVSTFKRVHCRFKDIFGRKLD